jgi:ubiquinone/menaquinone biosynthesis C-methylase UbiE
MTSRRPGIAHRRPTLHYLAGICRFWSSSDNRFAVEMAEVNRSDHLLDIGAGMGPAVVHAVTRVPEGMVWAVEPNRFMRSILRVRRLANRGRSRIAVLNGTAEALPVESGSIDTAWSVNTLHHWAELEQGASEVFRALRPGGKVILVDGDFAHPDHDYQRSGRNDHDHLLVDLDRVRDVLTAQGFAEVTSEERHVETTPIKMTTAVKPLSQ